MSSDSQVAVGWIVSSPLFCGTIWAACRPAQVLDFLGNLRSYLHVSLQRILVNILGPLSSSHTIVNSVLCRSYWQHQTLWSSEFQWLKKNLGRNFGWRWGCWTVTVDGLVSPVLASAPQSGLPDGQPVRPATRGVSPAE